MNLIPAYNSERMHKLAPGDRFFDINAWWYPANQRVVHWLYARPVSANQVTALTLVLGFASALWFLIPGIVGSILGAVFLYGKIFFDNVDGNLARVRGEVSRCGRFLDSLADFWVSFAVYAALSHRLASAAGDAFYWALGAIAFLSCLLQCSYFIFYLVSYTSRTGAYRLNRVREDITAEDETARRAGELTGSVYFLQKLHGVLYGWQDRLIEMLDRFSRRLAGRFRWPIEEATWYADKRFLSLSSPLCLCTNNMLLVVFALLGRPDLAFYFIVVAGNGYLLGLQFWKVVQHRASSPQLVNRPLGKCG